MEFLTCQTLALAGDSVAKRKRDMIVNQSLIYRLIERFWEVESLPDDKVPKMTAAELYALDIMLSTRRLCEDGRYEVGCLWKKGEPNFENNYCYAIKRLDALPRSKKYDWSKVYEWMDEIFLSWEKEGKIFQVHTETPRTDKGFYWPVFPVVRGGTASRMSRCRPVFDGAAAGGPNKRSINSALHKGPNFANGMVPVMLRFGRGPVAWVADLSEMFPNCKLNPETDGIYHKFLWRRGDKVIVYQSIGHVFGNKGSPAVAMFVVQTRAEELQEKYPDGADTILNSTIIDDNMDSFEDIEYALRVRDECIAIYGSCGMELKKMASNDPRLLVGIPKENILEKFRDMSSIAYPPVQEVFVPGEDGEEDHMVPVEREEVVTDRLHPKDPKAKISMKALGVKWDAEEDVYVFDVGKLDFATDRVTKRTCLSHAHSIFDPLGFVSAAVVEPRRIIQSCWASKVGWDEEIMPNEALRWKEWCKELHHLGEVKVPRCLIPARRRDITRLELHTFSDASEKAYGAVTYCLTETNIDGVRNCTSRYVMSRVKISPPDKKSIPRLELLGACLGKEIALAAGAPLGIPETECYFWSDSACVLCWLKLKAENLEIFVSNRTTQIKEATCPENWFHVPGVINPADIVSRGGNAKEVVESDLLWEGPPFLKQGYEKWPKQPPSTIPSMATKEFKVDFRDAMRGQTQAEITDLMKSVAVLDVTTAAVVATLVGHDIYSVPEKDTVDCDFLAVADDVTDELPDAVSVSDEGAVPVEPIGEVVPEAEVVEDADEVHPAVDSIQDAVGPNQAPSLPSVVSIEEEAVPPVDATEDILDDGGRDAIPGLDPEFYQEVVAAYEEDAQGNSANLLALIRDAQEESFPKDLRQLRQHGVVLKQSSIVCLGPKLDSEGTIRLPGRLKGANHLRWDVQNPILLKEDTFLAQGLMRHFHENVLSHCGGQNMLLAELNKRFWIIRGRPACRRYLRRCTTCQRATAARKLTQQEAPLPEWRVPGDNRIRPFSSILYDGAGPFYTRQGRCRARTKRWFVVFRCAIYGACHIEILYDMTSEKFLEAFERFANLRGWPERARSDRGTNFMRGAIIIEEVLNDEAKDAVVWGLKKRIPTCDFSFNTPHSPWKMGGAEAFVKLAKQALARIMYDGEFTDDELATALTKVTRLLNCRPIAYANVTEPEEFVAITPNTFLLGDWWDAIRNLSEAESRSYASRSKVFSLFLDKFWTTFVSLARSSQRRYDKWTAERANLEVGNIVLVFENRSRGLWPLARVVAVKVHPVDGLVRSATIRLQDGRLFERPINCLHVIRDDKSDISLTPDEQAAVEAEIET